MFRASHVVGALLLMTVSCNGTVTNVVDNLAAVRLINDTDTPLSIASGGVLNSANARLVFSQSSTCLFVDPSATTVPLIAITNGATGASIAFTPTLTAGANLMVVAFAAATLGDVQLAVLTNRFVPTIDDAGLRFFNGAPSAGSLIMRRDTTTLTPLVEPGSASIFVSVPIDSARVTFSSTSTVVLDAGRMAFPQGQNSTVVVGPPAQGAVPLRFFIAQGC
jgi:hypothetical protein